MKEAFISDYSPSYGRLNKYCARVKYVLNSQQLDYVKGGKTYTVTDLSKCVFLNSYTFLKAVRLHCARVKQALKSQHG